MNRYALSLTLCLSVSLTCLAQQPSLSTRAQKIKTEVGAFSPGDKMSVIRQDGPEEFGTLASSGSEEFVLDDIDIKRQVHLRYEDVRKIRRGYGRYNFVAKRHTDAHKSMIVGIVVIGVLIGLIVAAAYAA
jgi:hypothetical protein